jgi:signal peptidase I
MNESVPLTDQLANIDPTLVVLVLLGCTFVRLVVRKLGDQKHRGIVEVCDTINFVLALAFLLIRPFVAQAFYIPSGSMERTLEIGDRLVVDKVAYRLSPPSRGDVIVFRAPGVSSNPTDCKRTGATPPDPADKDFIKRCVGVPGDTVEVRAPRLAIDGSDAAVGGGVPGGQPMCAPEEMPVRTVVSNTGLHGWLGEKLGLDPIKGSVRIYRDHLLVNGNLRMEKSELAMKLGYPGATIEMEPGATLVNGKVVDEPFVREDPDYSMEPIKLDTDQYFMLGDNRNHSHDSHIWGTVGFDRLVGRARAVFWPLGRAGFIR